MKKHFTRKLIVLLLAITHVTLTTAQSFSESFNDVPTLFASGGWANQNLSNPVGPSIWSQGATATWNSFDNSNGLNTDWAVCNFNSIAAASAGTISNWMFTPTITTLSNGDSIIFYTRSATTTTWPDRMQVRVSVNGSSVNAGTTETSVGDFTYLQLDINPTYTVAAYPIAWQQYTVIISGLPAGNQTGRIAFRYFVEDGGPNGNNSNVIGIDQFRYGNFVSAGGNTITTGTINGAPFCPGEVFSVPYTITGTFTAGNVFTAQLSNAVGSFTTPTTIGSVTSTTSGSIQATIPSSITSGGLYRVRVIASNPSTTGSSNTVDLFINPASVSITPSSSTVCPGSSVTLTASLPDRMYGVILGSNYQTMVRFNAATPGTVAITDTFLASIETYGGDIGPNGQYYLLDNNSLNLYRVDLGTMQWTTVGNASNFNVNELVTGLAWNAANSTMYAIGSDGINTSLYTVNTNTGQVTLVNVMTNVQVGIWLAINNAGQAYTADIVTDQLFSVNLTTATTNLIGNLGVNLSFAQDADFDPITGVLYMAAYDSVNSQGQLRTVNLTTGASTLTGLLFNNGASEIDALAIAGAPTYAWSNGGSGQTATVTSAGTYTVTMTNASGCTATASTTISSGSVSASISPSNPTVCSGPVTLTASGGGTYNWSNGSSSASTSVSSAGTYTVTVTNNGCTATASVSVSSGSVSATISPSNPSVCAGGQVTLTASGGGTYNWSNGSTSASTSVSSAGSYTVTVTNNGCTATASVTVSSGSITATISPSNPTVCAGGQVSLTANGGTNYSWSTGGSGSSINVNNTGTYTVTATSGNCTATASVVVGTGTPPTAGITPGGPTTFCQGGSVQLTGTGGNSYAWSNGTSTAATTVSTQGLYVVTVTAANGCSATASQNVTVNAAPNASISANGATALCPGSSVTLTANGGTSFNWSNGGNTASITVNSANTYTVTVTNSNNCTATASQQVTTQSSQASISAGGATTFCSGGSVTLTASSGNSYNWSNGSTSQSITVNQGGSYSVTVTAQGGCTATASQSVTVNNSPNASIVVNGPSALCGGQSTTLSAAGGGTYSWSNGSTAATITVNTPATYTVTVTSNNCTATASQTISQSNGPSATITPSGPTTFCNGGSVNLAGGGGTGYNWSNGSTSSSITVTASGIFNLTVTDGSGCSATATQTVIVSVPSASITANGPTTFCPGGSVVLTASAANSYLWSNGGTVSSITVTTGGTYTVTITDASNCTATASQLVTVNNNPTTSISASNSLICATGGSVTLTAGSGTAYSWSNGSSSQTITVTSGGNYTVTVTLGPACTATASQTITQLPAISIAGSTTPSSGNNGAIDITVSSAFNPVVYSWSNGASTQDLSGLAPGNYSVTVTDANNCSATQSFSIVNTSISNVTGQVSFNVFPNPASGMVRAEWNSATTTSLIRVFDILGNVVFVEEISANNNFAQMDTRTWAEGVYTIQLETAGLRSSKKLVVTR